ncbi:hypothetical protein FRB96_005009 [Tulasnella sp. 330]|nr:hypothetical protein FRB96_005009 [Tulasnella sp. 330]KAG8886038.1 hypothetical protein FRB97_007914 [Tulasnella sp. 331]
MIRSAFLGAILFTASVRGQVAVYGQCGGEAYTGSTVCAAGSTCVFSSVWYSQCLPATSTVGTTTSTTSTTSSKATTTTSSVKSTTTSSTTSSTKSSTTTSTTKSTSSTTTTSAVSTSTSGFVKVSGQTFTLNGAPYTLVGENSYWVQQLTTQADIDEVFSEIAAMGATTVRTLGFNDVVGIPTWGVYYQSWSNGVATFNSGTTGIANFDIVVASAKTHGIKLVITLTNNWSDYGGMDVYVSQILNSTYHDLFYTDPKVISAFKTYISEFVGHYVNEPTILAWSRTSLAARAALVSPPGIAPQLPSRPGSRRYPHTLRASTRTTLAIGLGDEGFGMDGATDYVYSYGIGTNFTADLAVSSIDFGTFHSYPESWGETADPVGFGNTWITAHVAVGQKLNKPVIMEEFGVTNSNQTTTYNTWLNTGLTSGLAGKLVLTLQMRPDMGMHTPSTPILPELTRCLPASQPHTRFGAQVAL